MNIFTLLVGEKTNPIQSQSKPIAGLWAGILGISRRNRAFGLFKGDKDRKPAGKLAFLDEFDILCREMARFWPIGIAGQELNYFWRLIL